MVVQNCHNFHKRIGPYTAGREVINGHRVYAFLMSFIVLLRRGLKINIFK